MLNRRLNTVSGCEINWIVCSSIQKSPVLPELDEAGHAEDVEVEADPGEGEDEAEAAQHEAVQLHHPAEAGEAGAVQPQHQAGVRLPVKLRVEGAGPGAGLAVTIVTRTSTAPTLGQQAAGALGDRYRIESN